MEKIIQQMLMQNRYGRCRMPPCTPANSAREHKELLGKGEIGEKRNCRPGEGVRGYVHSPWAHLAGQDRVYFVAGGIPHAGAGLALACYTVVLQNI